MSESIFIDLICKKSCRHIREIEQENKRILHDASRNAFVAFNRISELEQQKAELLDVLAEIYNSSASFKYPWIGNLLFKTLTKMGKTKGGE